MLKMKMKTSLAGANFSYVPGDIVEVNEETAAAWQEHGLADLYQPKEVKVIAHKVEVSEEVAEVKGTEEDIPVPGEIKHVGGGWYLLPDGEKVQGKDEALAALAALQESDE